MCVRSPSDELLPICLKTERKSVRENLSRSEPRAPAISWGKCAIFDSAATRARLRIPGYMQHWMWAIIGLPTSQGIHSKLISSREKPLS